MSHNCFRIFTENYIDIDRLANTDYSSQQSAFPASNVYNYQRRSKVWRSNGRYKVTASNNQIIFKEASTVELTATIAIADYSSTTTFIAAIKAALDAAGVSTYTVIQDDLRFKITSNGIGGDGRFELITTSASFTADLLGYDDSADKTGSLYYKADNVVIHYPGEYLLWDMGVSTNPDAFILIGLRNDSLPYSPGATIKIEGNETNDFTTPSFSTSLTYDDEVLSLISDEGIATTGYRYWRVYFEDRTNGLGYIQVSAVFLGNYLDPVRGRAQYPLGVTYQDRSITVYSEGGQSFSDIKDQSAIYNITFAALKKEAIEEIDAFYGKVGTAKPFFVSMDTGEVYSTNKNRRIIFCKFSSDPNWQLISKDYFTLTMQLREEL